MRRKQRKFSPNGVQHIYQRAVDLGVIFYSRADRLVFYTLAACMAKKYGVKICAMAIMFTHFHLSIIVTNKQQMEKFMQDLTSTFARMFNIAHGRKGQLFQANYGWSSKVGEKRIRENLAYVYNNHVEKKLCNRSLDSRWSFLPYAASSHPFSKPTDALEMAPKLRRSVVRIKKIVGLRRYLNYHEVSFMFSGLNAAETEELTDYIISKYECVDFQSAIKYYGNYEQMCMALDSNIGAEHEINEDYGSESDRPYLQMLKVLKEDGVKVEELYAMTEREKREYAKVLAKRTGASSYQIARFLHIEDGD